MPYAFKVTAKQNIGGSKGIAKGMSVQCVEKSTSLPQIKTILEAFKNQHGIEIKGISVSTGYFTVEKLLFRPQGKFGRRYFAEFF